MCPHACPGSDFGFVVNKPLRRFAKTNRGMQHSHEMKARLTVGRHSGSDLGPVSGCDSYSAVVRAPTNYTTAHRTAGEFSDGLSTWSMT